MSGQAISALAPILVALATAILALMVQVFSTSKARERAASIALVGLAAVALSVILQDRGLGFGGVILADHLAAYACLLLVLLAAASTAAARDFLASSAETAEEYFALLLFALVGMLVMVSATELVVMFLGFETMSLAVYVLAGVWRSDRGSNEAAIKYFLLGAFASAVMVYGIALVYGAAASTDLAAIGSAMAGASTARAALMLGLALVMVGFGFKIAAVPFHLWTPDVYEGAPSSVTLFMATAVKAAAFVALLRVFLTALVPLWADFAPILWWVAALTMTAGNLAALRQTGLKRMLAYSAIAHTGYLLVGLTAVASTSLASGASALLFYLVVYGAMTTVAFAVLMLAAPGDGRDDSLAGLSGLAGTRPALALAMALAMLSLIGIPPLAGFIGKFYLFAAALEAGLTGLVLLAVFNTVVSAAYYLGVVRVMYFEQAPAGAALSSGARGPARPALLLTVGAAVAATVGLGLAPAPLLRAAEAVLATFVLGS